MAISDYKIYASDYTDKDISGLPDNVVGQADWLKARFDALTKEVVVPRLNSVLDELTSEEGAQNIGTGWKGKSLSNAVLSNDVRELRMSDKNRLEVAVDQDDWVIPPVGHTLVDAHGQERRETKRLQFVNADVSVQGDTTVVRPLSNGDGLPGRDGLSAYDEAVTGGFRGSQAKFDELLAGLAQTTREASLASHPNYLRNADFVHPFNTKGVSVYQGEAEETIDHWAVHSAENDAELTLSEEGLLFTAGDFSDALSHELTGLSRLAGESVCLTVLGVPQQDSEFSVQLKLETEDQQSMTVRSESVSAPEEGMPPAATIALTLPESLTDQDRLMVSLRLEEGGQSVLLKWAKLELGQSGTPVLPREPALERLVSGPDVGYKAGCITGNASQIGTTRVVDCGFTPSAVLMVVDGSNWYKGSSGSAVPYYRASGYIGLATREYPHATSDLNNAIQIVEGGFKLTLNAWSEFNRTGYKTNYIAFR